MRNVEKAQSTTRKPDTICEGMLNAMKDSPRNLPGSDDEEDD
jgi:hypothetical protein